MSFWGIIVAVGVEIVKSLVGGNGANTANEPSLTEAEYDGMAKIDKYVYDPKYNPYNT